MFTGIIENQAVVLNLEPEENSLRITLETPIASDFHIDQSMAHNGICLTITDLFPQKNQYQVVAVQETLQKTTIPHWNIGNHINLERCLRLGDRLDGHWVQGHIDATGIVTSIKNQYGSYLFDFSFPEEFAPLLVSKGSICIDGISLTVAQLSNSGFSVVIIPYTYDHTNINALKEGAPVNLEFDVIGKYLLRFKEILK